MANEKGGPAAPGQYEPTKQDRTMVQTMAGYRLPDRDIARILQISVPALHKHFAADMELGRARVNANLAQRLYEIAMGREREVRQVEKTKIGRDGKERRYMGQEVVREAQRPNAGVALFLAQMWLGWQNGARAGAVTDPNLPDPNALDLTALTDAELVHLQKLFAKMGAPDTGIPSELFGSNSGGANTSRH